MKKKVLSLLLALVMLLSLVPAGVFAAADKDIYWGTTDTSATTISVPQDDLKKVLRNNFTITKLSIQVKGEGISDTVLGKGAVQLTVGGDYTIWEKGTVGSWAYVGTFTFKKATITPKSEPTVNFYSGKTVTEEEVFDAVKDTSAPDNLKVDDVTIEYLAAEDVAVVGDIWGALDYKATTALGHKFGADDRSTETVRITYKNGDTNCGVLWQGTLKLEDLRAETSIAGTEDISLPLNTADFEAALQGILHVEDETPSKVAEGTEIDVTVNDGDEITAAGSYSVTAAYAGNDSYKPVAETFNIEVTDVDHYSVAVTTAGESGKASAPGIVFLPDSSGFTVTATPDSGSYTASILVKNGDKTVASSGIGKNELTVPAESFAKDETADVTVSFAKASITVQDGYIDTGWGSNGNETHKQSIFNAVYVSAFPEDIGWDDITSFQYAANKDKDGQWQNLDNTSTLNFKHKFTTVAGNYENIRLGYKYNNVTITVQAKVTVAEDRKSTKIVVDGGASDSAPIVLKKGGNYKADLQGKAEVQLTSDSSKVDGAEIIINGLDESLINEVQQVSFRYTGNASNKAAEPKTAYVKIKDSKTYSVATATDGNGSGMVNAQALYGFDDAGETSNALDFTVTPDAGCYLDAISVTINGGTAVEHGITVSSPAIGENSYTVAAGKFAPNDAVLITATFKKASLTLKSGIQDMPNNWKTGDELKSFIYNAVVDSITPASSGVDDVTIEYYKFVVMGENWHDVTTAEQFPTASGETATIQITYTYNGEDITETATVKLFDPRDPSSITPKEELKIKFYDGMDPVTEEDVFNAIVASTVPEGLTYEDVEIKYDAEKGSLVGSLVYDKWRSINDTNYDELVQHAFGALETETIRISFAGNEAYKPFEQTFTLNLEDTRATPAPVFNDPAELNYFAYFSLEDGKRLDTATKKVLEKAVLAALLNGDKEQLPNLLEQYAEDKVEIEYCAADYADKGAITAVAIDAALGLAGYKPENHQLWVSVDFAKGPITEIIDKYSVDVHTFGENGPDSTEQIRISFKGNADYKSGEWTQELTLSDLRIPTAINVSYTALESGVAELLNRLGISTDKIIPVQYSTEKKMKDEVLSRLSVVSTDGESADPTVDLETEITVSPEMLNVNLLKTQKLTVKYAGNNEYQPSEKEITVFVLQANASLKIKNEEVRYDGNAHYPQITTSPADLDYFTLIVGVDGDGKGFASFDFPQSTKNAMRIRLTYKNATAAEKEAQGGLIGRLTEALENYIKEQGNKTIDTVMGGIANTAALANIVIEPAADGDWYLDIYKSISDMSDNNMLNADNLQKMINGLKALEENEFISTIIGSSGFDVDSLNTALSVLSGVYSILPKANIYLGKGPVNAGLYEVTAFSTDINYVIKSDIGLLTILPKTEGVALKWNAELPDQKLTKGFKLGDITIGDLTYGKSLTWEEAQTFDFGATLCEDDQPISDSEKYVRSIYGGAPVLSLPEVGNEPIRDPGTYYETIFVLGGNYYASNLVRRYEIERIPVKIEVDGASLDPTYSGERNAVKATATAGDGTDLTGKLNFLYVATLGDIHFSGTAPADAAIYLVTISFAGDSKYAPAVTNVTLTVKKATPTVTLTDKTVTYNTLPQPVNAAVDLGVTGESYGKENKGILTYAYFTDEACTKLTTVLGDGALLPGQAPSHAGTYYVKAYLSGYNNYTDAVSNVATLTIEKADPGLTIINRTYTYDGQPHAGFAAVELVGVGNTLEAIYGKNAISYTYYESYDPDTDTLSDPVDGMPVNAGTYYVEASLPESWNYNAISSHLTAKGEPGTLTIGKAKLTITVDAKKVYVNDKKPFELTYTQTGLCNPPDRIEISCPTLDLTKVGKYPIILANREELAKNYDITMNEVVVDVMHRPSGNPAITVHVGGENISVDVIADAKDNSYVTIRDTMIDDIEEVIGRRSGNVILTVDLTDTERTVNTVSVPVKALEKILAALEDTENPICFLTFKFADGKAMFDADALRELLADADEKTLELALAEYEGLVCPKNAKCILAKYTDLKPDAWYHDGVHYCLVRGLMTGKTESSFSPKGAVTRQQVWMILARLSGEKPANMAEAKAWAIKSGVSDGSNPTNTVTRQQLAAMLYRYAQQQGKGFTGDWTFRLDCKDRDSIADYAYEAMCWCNMNKIVGGYDDGTVRPTARATRAQLAVMLQRFCENI